MTIPKDVVAIIDANVMSSIFEFPSLLRTSIFSTEFDPHLGRRNSKKIVRNKCQILSFLLESVKLEIAGKDA